MQNTPFLPAFRCFLAPVGSRCVQAFCFVRSHTLSHLESCLGAWIPSHLFPKAHHHEGSRDRIYTRWRTFWCMIWQALNPDASGREVVRQLQALLTLENGPAISEEDAAYCRAKGRLALDHFPLALAATAKAADHKAPAMTLLRGRPLKAIDGSALTLADTSKNRNAYPPLQCAHTPSFPMLRLV